MEERVEFSGSAIRAKREGGLLLCPVCKKALFYTAEDLLHHIKSHAEGYEKDLVKVRREEEEEEEE